MNPYRQDKVFQHLDRVKALCRGQHPAPVHVQIIISDLCNQNCIPAGSMIECPEGKRPIEEISPGDWVIGPNGVPVRVRITGNRWADELFEVKAGNHVLQATGEHPILTDRGWVEARHLQAGRDSVVVRVRMREISQVEPALEAVGEVYSRSLARGADEVRCLESKDATEDKRSASASLSVRMRPASDSASTRCQESLVRLSQKPSNARKDEYPYSGRSSQDVRTNAPKQPDAGPGCGCACPSHAAPGVLSNQGRVAILEVGEEKHATGQLPRNWSVVGESQESRLSSSRTEQSNRDYHEGNFQRHEDRLQDARGLRDINRETLHAQRLGVPRDLLRGRLSTSAPIESTASGPRLLLEGIEMERGLGLRPIDSIRRITGHVRVFNFSCPPIESYEVNGIIAHNCGFCCYRTDGYSSNQLFFTRDSEGEILSRNPTRFIPLEKIHEILDDCSEMGVKAIEITGGGEPTVHPQHATIFRYVRDSGMDLGVVTNGVSLDERAIAPLAEPGAETWVRVSIDSGTQETYTTTRSCPPRHWDLAWRTVRRLAVAKTTTPRSPLVVGVSFVLTKENWREVVMATQLAIAAGADNIRIGGLFQNARTNYYEPFLSEARELCAEAASLATPEFAVINLFGDRYQDLVQGPPDYRACGYQRVATYIGGDLGLYRCCVQSYNRRGFIGSLKDQRFSDVWWGLANNPDYLQFDTHGCAMCQHNTKNRAIANAVESQRHGNFV